MKQIDRAVLSISENLRPKGQGHHMTKYGPNTVLDPQLHNIPGRDCTFWHESL